MKSLYGVSVDVEHEKAKQYPLGSLVNHPVHRQCLVVGYSTSAEMVDGCYVGQNLDGLWVLPVEDMVRIKMEDTQ